MAEEFNHQIVGDLWEGKAGALLIVSVSPRLYFSTIARVAIRRGGIKNMLSQFIKGRVYVFVDVENVFYCQRTLGWKISYQKLMTYLKQECGEDVKVFTYSGKDENNTGQAKFLDMLEMNGYVVRTKVVKKIKSGTGGHK